MTTTENDPSGLVSFLSQGAAVGALLGFPIPVMGLLSNDPYYGMLFVAALPWYLSIGVGFGVMEAIMLWACTYIAGRRLNVFLRIGIALVVLAGLVVLVDFVFSTPSPYDREVSQTEDLAYIDFYVVCGMSFGLMIGSRFRPLNELARGGSFTGPPKKGE